MSFANIVGNDKIKTFLDNQIKNNHVLHSYLFVGIEGIGKELFAEEFAKKILCLEKNDEDEKCLSCIKWNSLNHPDFTLIKPEDKIIKIEQIRNMQEKIAEKPITSKKKVYIIIDSEYMTKEAQNCLLKTLEEPPEYATIILTTSNESKLLNTIKSRCIKVQFDCLSENEMKDFLMKNSSIEPTQAFIKMSQGSIGKLLHMEENHQIYEQINNILENIDKQDLITVLNKSEIVYKEKEKIQEILDYINVYLYYTKDIKKLNCTKYVEDTKKRLISNSNYDMCIDYLLIKIWEEVNEKYSRSKI